MKTLILLILDESGSMGNTKSDVIGGFNSFLEDQKKVEEDEARMCFIKFSTSVTIAFKSTPLNDVPTLNVNNYLPGGGTALYDAIAEGVRLAEKDRLPDERVLCVIMTDGEENSSKETTKQQVKDIISGHEAKGDWTFLYIGENPERWAQESGGRAGNQRHYIAQQASGNFAAGSAAVSRFRRTMPSEEDYGFGLFD